ncbi:MAG: hypothetical protein JST32_20305 [Bacteroidetes bacterium]|nr:hypothetical protein [Bacteroidota bacterium]
MKAYANHLNTRVFILTCMALGLLFFRCKKGANTNRNNNVNNATSHICGQVTGVEAIYWDLMNGIPRTDLPNGVPTVTNPGGTYIHPTFPLLTFIYPSGYTPETDQTSGAVGVNLIRNDEQAIWRYTSIFYSGNASAQVVLNNEVTQLRAFLKSNGTVSTICSQQGSLPRAAGITSTIATAFIRFDNFSAALNVTITTESGLGAEQINIVTTAAPTNQFSNEILHTFLPIDYQLLYKDDGEQDSDGDGYPDSQDAFPFDPTKH